MITTKYMPVRDGWNHRDWTEFPNLQVPWAMMEPHDIQARRNHCDQSLEVLRSRGGMSSCEALAILDGRLWVKMQQNEAHEELVRRIKAFTQPQPAPTT